MKLIAQNKIWICVILLFLSICVIEGSVQKCRGDIPQTAGPAFSSIYALAGEFRTVFANLLWIKTDKYLHEHVAGGGDAFANKEALPMIKIITELDPHFIEAYRTGAMMLYLGLNKDEEALRFLREGISRNPNSWELYEELGMYYAVHKRDLKTALPYLEKSYEYCGDAFFKKRMKRFIDSVKRDLKEEERNK